ncbi:MAG: signal peptide peptidase SppA [Deltaproteobacteria bacterium]|nr:signal peptide peptidase SppA [Deltaproteobacteria bacterium]
MEKRGTWVLVIIFGGLFVALFGFLGLAYVAVKGGSEDNGSSWGKPGIGVIEVKGQIGNLDKPVKQLRKFEKDDNIKAIIMRVDSPGGAVAPSQELHDEVQRAMKKGKPVVVSMGNLAASGGYYISCGATKIFAEPGTLTASIGVITELPNLTGVADWAHFKMTTYKSGKLKDSGNPFREPNADDEAYFKSIIANIYEQFVGAVADGRKLPKEKVLPIADGRVLTGIQAKEAGLVDELGGFSDAIDAAMSLGKLEGEPHLIYPAEEEKGLFHELMKDGADSLAHGLADGLKGEIAPVQPTFGPVLMMPFPAGKAE